MAIAMAAERAYVPNMATPTLMTADELLHVHIPDKRVELVRGVLVVSEPPGFLHGGVTARLAKVLIDYSDTHGLGQVVAGDAGFKIESDPDTVRGPDVAFVRRERVPHPSPIGYAGLAPDLAVEVLSPGDRPGEVLAKVADWLTAGTRLVWVVDPQRRVTRVYRYDGSETLVTAEGALDGEDVLPGFSCPLASVV
jgi:Uma2 family endonuclease